MDKRNQMENPFFDPDKPGSIFVGMDRYHQYSPYNGILLRDTSRHYFRGDGTFIHYRHRDLSKTF